MIDYRFILLIISTLLIFIVKFNEDESLAQALLWVAALMFFFIGTDIMISGIVDISIFLSTTTGIVFWGLGLALVFRASFIGLEDI
jgi:hypothetical protein